MKIFLFSGEGVWLASTVIVQAETKEEAIELIKHALKKEGLEQEVPEEDIVEIFVEKGLIYINSGIY